MVKQFEIILGQSGERPKMWQGKCRERGTKFSMLKDIIKVIDHNFKYIQYRQMKAKRSDTLTARQLCTTEQGKCKKQKQKQKNTHNKREVGTYRI